MSTVPAPTGLAFIVCDTVIEDAISRKKSLIGIFSQISASSFPCKHPHMNLYVVLTEGRGTIAATIRCSNLNNNETVLEVPIEVAFKNPNQIVELNVQIDNIRFPEAGPYLFSLLYDSAPVIERRFMVSPMKSKES